MKDFTKEDQNLMRENYLNDIQYMPFYVRWEKVSALFNDISNLDAIDWDYVNKILKTSKFKNDYKMSKNVNSLDEFYKLKETYLLYKSKRR